ncbi:MAG: hypothetical protein ABR603_04465 [Pyrinomonadaceae bacterium]
MKSLALRLAVAVATFAVGVFLTLLAFDRPAHRVVVVTRAVDTTPKFEVVGAPGCDLSRSFNGGREETPEEKPVRLAEEFVARNGYTDLPADRENLSYESIEWAGGTDEMLEWRRDSLERKAYGIYYSGRGRERGWTVVFRPTDRYDNVMPGAEGVAVTMDENFENLRVEHKSFPLGNVDKKF